MLEWLTKRDGNAGYETMDLRVPLVPTGCGGFLAGTRVASNLGWRAIEALDVGDQVLTFDHGMQPITEMHRDSLVWTGGAVAPLRAPVFVPSDALHNRAPVWMMPDQGVLIESDLIENLFDDPFAIVPACTLVGYRGIERVTPGQKMNVVMPRFAEDQAIYLEAGTLGYSPAKRDLITYGVEAQDTLYRVLSTEDARSLVVDLIAQDDAFTAEIPFTPSPDGSNPFGMHT